MDAVEFEIVSAALHEPMKYKLVFQDIAETEVCEQVTSKPHFEAKKYLVPVKDTPKGGSGLVVAVFGEKDGVQQKLGERTFFLASSIQRHNQKLLFYADDTSSVDGMITIEYRFTKFPVTHALKGDRVYCVSVQAAHLNTLVETPFSLSLSACLLDDIEPISPAVHLTNQDSHGHINLVDLYDSLSTRGIDVVIVDEVTAKRYKVTVAPLSPVVVSIPMSVGDPLVLTLQCMYTMEVGRQMVTGLVHSSYMREAAIIQTPGSTARKISLSPRRTTTFDQSAAAVGLLGTGQAIPSTKKTLLFLEDSQLNVRTTPNSAIIGGIQCAEQIDAQGKVISSRPVENFHEAYLSEIAARVHGEGQKHRHIGPATGAYVVCNSKSEVLDTEVNKKTHKKQTLTVNLGTLQVAQSTLTGPVKIRAKLVDLLFSAVGERVNLLGNVASEGKHQQKAVIAYVGLLEEASRELFNDTGLVACTLEGKLFKPANAATAAASVARDASGASGGAEGEETCVAVKLYVTLVPSREEAASEHSDSENSEGEGEGDGKLNPRSGKSSRRPSRLTSAAEGSASRRVSFSGGGSAEPNAAGSAAPEPAANSGPEPGTSRSASAASLPKSSSKDDISSDVKRRIDDNLPYNVVDRHNALPDELHGSSSLLAVPSHHASQRSSAAELKALSKSRSNVTVPPLPLGGSAAGSQAASAASLPGHIAGEESRFVSMQPSKSALSAAGSVGGSVTHSLSAESLLNTEPSLGRGHKGAFGESLEPAAVARAAGGGREPHLHAAAGVAFAEAIRGELAQKQRTIDELTEDLRVRNEAIQVCGFDIRNLREETIRLNNRIAAMETEKAAKVEAERKADEVTSEILKYPNLLSEMDKPTLVRNVHRLRDRVQGLDKDKAALEAALRKATDVIAEYAALKKDHGILQAAHVEQTKYLQKMQGKIAQISAYQETIKNQEKIITKMQTIVESKLRAKNALPFQTKPSTQIPVPQADPFALPPSLPDFESIQAQKVNEEALLQARLEIEELNEKVRDLEHQLYEAKLAQYDHGEDEPHSEAGSESGDQPEREAPNSSVMQELTDEERAKFEDLQVANARIDELEAENTSKAYRISALEEQLEVSTRDYSREIARLRTKLFELEITAAMADDRPGSGAGEEDFMEMDLDALLQIPEPGAAKAVSRAPNGEVEERSPSGKPSAPPTADRDTSQRGSEGGGAKSAVPVTPPGAPSAGGPSRMNSFLRSPAASGAASATTSAKHTPPAPAADTTGEQSLSRPSSLDAEEEKSGDMGRVTRPASGSARAAALSIKNNPDFAETAGGAKKRKLSARGASGELGPTSDALDHLVLSTEEPIGTGLKVPSPTATAAPEDANASKTDQKQAAVPEKASDGALPGDGATTPVSKPQHAASAENLSLGPSPPESVAPSRTSPLPSAKPSTQSHPVSEHPPNEGEPLVRVPKFRKKSIDNSSGVPRLGIGAEGPIDPDALEKTVDLTMEIIDADQVSPRTEATVRTKKDNKIVLAMLTLTMHCLHDHIRKTTAFKILKLKLHGFSQDLLQDRFDPYLKLSVGSKWSCVTGHVKSSGMTAMWEFDPEHGFFDKKFTLTDEDMESSSNTLLICVVKKKNERAHEDFECGTGTVVLSKSVFD